MTSDKARLAVGLMSGTSADGIDAVLAELRGSGATLKAKIRVHVHLPFPAALQRRILRAALHGAVAEICELNFELGERLAKAVLRLLKVARVPAGRVDVVCSHGQTIHHLPRAKFPSTLQIGEPSVIAERTGITTVADFRVRDIAAGGQGAPLVPYADWTLFRHRSITRTIQNIGGIGNLTFLPPGGGLDEVLAFDTGPGNMVIDALAARYSKGKLRFDKGGRWAARGRIDGRLLRWLMSHPFLQSPPPKTTGREEFGEVFLKRLLKFASRFRITESDMMATGTAFTAASIVEATARYALPRLRPRQKNLKFQVVLGGGGARNATLRRMLDGEFRAALGLPGAEGIWSRAPQSGAVASFELLTHEDFGIGEEAKEALAFAILGHETLQGRPSNVMGATGARHPAVLGKIIMA